AELNGTADYGIGVQKLSADGLSLAAGSKPTVVKAMVGRTPRVVKRNGYYYVFSPTGGLHSIWVARSKTLLGTYTSHSTADDEPLTSSTDCTVDTNQQLSVLAIGKNDYILYSATCAHTAGLFLDRITWSADGWPTIGNRVPTTTPQAWPE